MQCGAPAVALSVDGKDPLIAIVSYTQGAPEFINFHRGTSKPLPTIPLGSPHHLWLLQLHTTGTKSEAYCHRTLHGYWH